ncbi:MAG: AAA family ATPase [Candidatus Lokiarchaeota archaeon]|nr:AAA family ATPase [Candidatus Lokiarchaeota archaeon]
MAKKKAPAKKKPAPAVKESVEAEISAKEPKTKKNLTLELGTNAKKQEDAKTKIRTPVEELKADEILALIQNDTYPKPPNWQLSPKMVELFILGSNEEFKLQKNGSVEKIKITPKFFGDRNLVQKSIVTLTSERALMLIGEPGTAKSWLSEHLAAAISGKSTYLIQGTAGTTEDQIRYSWNYALLVSEGPSPKSLVPSPTINAMNQGKVLRFEELTRCPQEIQDSMISILSEKVIPVPELGSEYLIFGTPGFNVIATANDRDRGVNEMSAALKRRFNFIYIPVIEDKEMEKKIVTQRTNDILSRIGFKIQIPEDTLDLLVTVFQELRTGKSHSGGRFSPLSTVMSTSEEISLLLDSAIYANFFGKQVVEPEHIAMNIVDSVVKDDKENLPKLKEYFDMVVKHRGTKAKHWKEFEQAFRKIA